MPTQRLTERAASAARTAKVQEDLRDSVVPGLILRVYQTGRKTWGYDASDVDGVPYFFVYLPLTARNVVTSYGYPPPGRGA